MKHPSSLTWFKYLAGDLSPLAYVRLGVHCVLCRDCAQRRERERQAGLVRLSPARWLLLAVPVAACFMFITQVRHAVEPDVLTAKGGHTFDLWGLKNPCHPHEVLQADLGTTGAYVTVVEVAPSGTLTSLFSDRVEGKRRVNRSWTLDDELGLERFIAIFADQPAVDVEKIVRGAKPAGVTSD
ncbi:MAG: hypothetical protein ACT4TC_05650 [Myxococcaceae bacterium]